MAPLIAPILCAGVAGRMGKAARAAAIERAKASGWAALAVHWDAAGWGMGEGSDGEDGTPVRMDKPTYLLAFESALSGAMRRSILDAQLRPDGRGPTDLRPITARAGYLPHDSAVHGSALFSRGETQALCTATVRGLPHGSAAWLLLGTVFLLAQPLMLHGFASSLLAVGGHARLLKDPLPSLRFESPVALLSCPASTSCVNGLCYLAFACPLGTRACPTSVLATNQLPVSPLCQLDHHQSQILEAHTDAALQLAHHVCT